MIPLFLHLLSCITNTNRFGYRNVVIIPLCVDALEASLWDVPLSRLVSCPVRCERQILYRDAPRPSSIIPYLTTATSLLRGFHLGSPAVVVKESGTHYICAMTNTEMSTVREFKLQYRCL